MIKILMITALLYVAYILGDGVFFWFFKGYNKSLNRFLDRMIHHSNITPMHHVHYLLFCVIGLIIDLMLIVFFITEQM